MKPSKVGSRLVARSRRGPTMSSRSLRADIEPGPVEAVMAEPSISYRPASDRGADAEPTASPPAPAEASHIQTAVGFDAPSTAGLPTASINSATAALTVDPKDTAEQSNFDDGPTDTAADPAVERRFNYVGAQPVSAALETRPDSDGVATPQAVDDLASRTWEGSEPATQSMSDRLEAAAELRTTPLAAERPPPNEMPAPDFTEDNAAAPEHAVQGRLVESELGGTTSDPHPTDPGSQAPASMPNSAPSGAAQPSGGAQSPPVIIGSIEIVNPSAPAARPDPLAPIANRRRQGRRQSRSRAMRGLV